MGEITRLEISSFWKIHPREIQKSHWFVWQGNFLGHYRKVHKVTICSTLTQFPWPWYFGWHWPLTIQTNHEHELCTRPASIANKIYVSLFHFYYHRAWSILQSWRFLGYVHHLMWSSLVLSLRNWQTCYWQCKAQQNIWNCWIQRMIPNAQVEYPLGWFWNCGISGATSARIRHWSKPITLDWCGLW